MRRLAVLLGAAFAALLVSCQPALALVTAPNYLDSAGRPAAAIGIVCINPDTTSCTFGGGGGGGAITAAASSFATGFSPDLGKIGDAACSTDNGAGCDLIQLVMRTNQRSTAIIAAIGAAPMQSTGGTVGLVAGSAIVGKISQVDSGGADATDTTNHAVKVNVVAGGSTFSPWLPDNGSLQTLAPTASASASSAFGGAGTSVYIKNIGTVSFHVRIGTSGVTAVGSDERLQPGMCGPFARNSGDRVSLITDGGTGSAEVTTGTGNPGFGVCTNLSSASQVAGADGAAVASAANPLTTGGCTIAGTVSTASTNALNVKNAAGTFCGGMAINTSATLGYIRWYNLTTTPTCSSATGYVTTTPVPASATGNGTLLDWGTYGGAFTTGIGWCITGGGTSTDNTNAPAGIYVNYSYK